MKYSSALKLLGIIQVKCTMAGTHLTKNMIKQFIF